jgi:hypothetical protein
MKKLILALLFSPCAIVCNAQVDSVGNTLSNSFEEIFMDGEIEIKYTYVDSTQTHNYSGNWDFDFDGKTDSVYFVGNGGAHLYFNLKIILSSDSLVQNITFLLLDFPLLEKVEKLKQEKFYPLPNSPQFVVYDFDSDGRDEIFLNIDKNTFNVITDDLNKHDVTSRYVLLDFEDTKIEMRNFIK